MPNRKPIASAREALTPEQEALLDSLAPRVLPFTIGAQALRPPPAVITRLDVALVRVRDAADAVGRAGRPDLAAAILKAVEPRRGRGSPPTWTELRVAAVRDAVDLLRGNPTLSERLLMKGFKVR